MARSRNKKPRPEQGGIIRWAVSSGLITGTSFGAHLESLGRGERTIVSHWAGRKRHMPISALFDLLDHLGEDAGELLGWIAARYGYRVERLDREPVDSPTVREAVSVELRTAEVVRTVFEATDPRSPGGVEWTEGERARLAAAAIEARRELDSLA